MGVQVPLWRPFYVRLMQLAVILLSDGRSIQVRLLYRPPSQCAIGGTADTADLGSAASAWGFKSLIAHHASIIQWPGSLPSKQMMRVRFPLDAPLGNSTTASASGSDPECVCSIHTSPAIYKNIARKPNALALGVCQSILSQVIAEWTGVVPAPVS